MTWFKRNPERINPDELMLKAEASLEITHAQQERVNLLTTWLDRRKDQNGFGDDFEYTLQPKGAL